MKLKINTQMKTALKRKAGALSSQNEQLKNIAHLGFVGRDGCSILRAFADSETNAKLASFPDKTGYECFINSLHIEDFASGNQLYMAIDFARDVLALWESSNEERVLNAILVLDNENDDVVVKFHELRSAESWVADDVEKYDDGVLVLNSRNFKDLIIN